MNGSSMAVPGVVEPSTLNARSVKLCGRFEAHERPMWLSVEIMGRLDGHI